MWQDNGSKAIVCKVFYIVFEQRNVGKRTKCPKGDFGSTTSNTVFLKPEEFPVNFKKKKDVS